MQPVTTSTGRLHNLDYLRGLAAASIMVYHYTTWSVGEHDASSFLGVVGIYGVSIFYVLSGLTLQHVYERKLVWTTDNVASFYIKRIFRIFPLLILVTLLTIILSRHLPSIEKIVLNVTGLFSVYKIDSYIAVGAWSIGNELSFYLLFPLLVFSGRYNRYIFWTLGVLCFSLYCYFAFVWLSPTMPLHGQQWIIYINPLNQVFLFFSGFAIGHVFKSRGTSQAFLYCLLSAGLLILMFYPASGDAAALVTGLARIMFTFACISICLAFLKIDFRFPPVLHRALSVLGEISYSVYLLHPIVWGIILFATNRILRKEMIGAILILKIGFSITVTLGIAYVVYRFYEQFFIGLGEKVIQFSRTKIFLKKLSSK
jgi:exopolysaccharide production protein ExoZ